MAELYFGRYNNELRLTHYLFRFPAKFHPAAVRCLLDEYSSPGDLVLDPFCGSGTLLVEAVVAGRSSFGVDVDPVAAFISRAKSRPISPRILEKEFALLLREIEEIRRPASAYDQLIHSDFSQSAVERYRARYRIPAIPNLSHWFRAYVALDLARLRLAILGASISPRTRNFFLACFAGIIRNASNADPVPVSGLEVTSHMRKLDKQGRRIDPFELFERRTRREIDGMTELWNNARPVSVQVRRSDATALSALLSPESVDVAITSPPYNTAVDYYRRHALEMYWLGLVTSHEERIELATHYLGRVSVRKSNSLLKTDFASEYIRRLIRHAKQISPLRERAVHHYAASMQRTLRQLARALKPRAHAVFVVGNSKWNGRRVRATKLIRELAKDSFEVVDTLSYSSRNRYMTYERHNGADVNREHVLVLRKKPTKRR
jgi:SAM-dependent methyltransferase